MKVWTIHRQPSGTAALSLMDRLRRMLPSERIPLLVPVDARVVGVQGDTRVYQLCDGVVLFGPRS